MCGLIALVVAIAWLLPGTTRGVADDPSAADYFEKQIRPLFVEKCHKCHGTGKIRGGLSLAGRDLLLKGGDSGAAAVPGKPKESLLVEAVEHRGELKMPPNGKLSATEIDHLKHWIEVGLPWPDARVTSPAPPAPGSVARPIDGDTSRAWWSFQPVRRADPPAVKDTAWPRSEIDRFILAGLEASGLKPAMPADKRTLLRRATFDLTGLPPTPEEVDAFLADESPDAFARVVDRLLASPHYGERWGRHWLDVVRYADARDLIQLPAESDFREAWRYRDWVVEAFNRDMPYAEFVRYQIAGDLLPPTRPGGINTDGLVATGMLAIADFVPGDVDKDQMIADYVNDEIDVVGRAFLGLTDRLRPLPRPQVRPDLHRGLLLAGGNLLQHPPDPRARCRATLHSSAYRSCRRTSWRESGARRRRQATAGGAGAAVPDSVDRAYIAHLKRLVTEQTARYLVAACEYRNDDRVGETPAGRTGETAEAPRGLAGRVGRFPRQGREAAAAAFTRPCATRRPASWTDPLSPGLPASCSGSAACRAHEASPPIRPRSRVWPRACVLRFRADDPQLADRLRRPGHCSGRTGPGCRRTPGRQARQRSRQGDRHDQRTCQGRTTVRRPCPARSTAHGALDRQPVRRLPGREDGRASQRLLGWEDSDVGKHGLSLMPEPGGPLAGDPSEQRPVGRHRRCTRRPTGSRSSASPGARTARPCIATAWRPVRRKGIDAVSSDPAIKALHLGGPGSGSSPRFRGDIAEVRVYDRQLDDAGRKRVETELHGPGSNRPTRNRCRETPSPNSSKSCSPPGGLSGWRRTHGGACSPPRSVRAWTI